jgi:phenylpropionate dioxygenase-like ring-hydroxylating dioxygenase large terminal subunit
MAEGQAKSGIDRWEFYGGAAVDGLTEYWYPAMPSGQLKRNKPARVRLLGRDLVLVRNQDRVYALDDRCPHREVPLSMGSCEFAGHITCVYHGWTFDLASGVLKAALTDGPNSPIAGKAKVRTYPVEERAGMVFAWMGEAQPVPIEDELPPELLRPDARAYWLLRDCRGNWRYASENGFDEAHNKMLHRSSPWVLFRRIPAWNETEIIRTEDGKWIARRQREMHMDDEYPGLGRWPRFNFWQRRSRTVLASNAHAVSMRLPCLLRVIQPGRGTWTHFNWYMPVQRDTYRDVVAQVRWVDGWWGRLTWWLRHKTYIWLFHRHHFLTQDMAAIAAMPDTHPERFFRPDISITAWRRLVETEARRPPPRKAPSVAAE